VTLTGVCNQCGRCCEVVVDGVRLRCEHLAASAIVGTPGATECRVYAARYDGLPIWLTDLRTGQPRLRSHCAKGSPAETQAILERGIGQGCSLTVADG